MREVLLANCASMRAQIGSLQAQLVSQEHAIEAAFGEPEPQAPQTCQHIETEAVGTFGAPETRCVACKQIV